jgi:chitin disaccharide deacetylase
MTAGRVLVVNADDLGRSPSINAGIARAHERGIVTSASLMVRWPDAVAAAAYARRRPRLGVGLHLDLGEWTYGAGAWPARYEVCDLGDAGAVEAEARTQLAAFRRLLGRDPTHLDSHQHVHRRPVVAEVAAALADELGVPLRHRDAAYCGAFYGQGHDGLPCHEAIAAEHLAALVAGLAPGVTELACHPGEGGDADDDYAVERPLELAALCDPRVRDAVRRAGVALRPFGVGSGPGGVLDLPGESVAGGAAADRGSWG